MSIIKEYREFFLRHTLVSSGAKPDKEVGFPLQYIVTGVGNIYNRFLKGDYPSEATTKKLLESITFKLNVEDTATTSEQGLVRTATDTEAEGRTSNGAGVFENVVKPHHLPNIVLLTDGNDAIVGSPVELGGLKLSILRRTISGKFWKNFKVEVNVDKSVVIDGTTKKVQLSGDIASPGNNYFYTTNGSGTKGWNTMIGYIQSIVTAMLPTVPAYTFNKSVKLSTLNIELDGDNNTPGNDKMYATNGSGTKGWITIPTVAPSVETIVSYIALPGTTTRYLELNASSLGLLGFFTKYIVINNAVLIGYCATSSVSIIFNLFDKDDNLLETVTSTTGTDASGYFRVTLPITHTQDNKFCYFEVNVGAALTRLYGIELTH